MSRVRWMVAAVAIGWGCGGGCGGGSEGPEGSDQSTGTSESSTSAVTSTSSASLDSTGTTIAGTTTTEGSSSSDGGSSTGEPPVEEPWEPGTVYPTPEGPNARGLLDRRGAIHTHSVYSHDACDGMPQDAGGVPDPVCLEDLRRGLCQTQHDFVMFTDHGDSFADNTFPDVLLYDPARGDVLVERGGDPVASWAGCVGQPVVPERPTLIMAGCESGTMPIGLEHHAPGLGATYGSATPAAIDELRAAGAVILVAHTEEWDVSELVDLPLDGFEMYNLHANLEANIAAGLALLTQILTGDPGLPHSDLVLFPLWQEDPRYLERWGSVLSSGVRRVTTMGTDAHRNSFPQELPDGERIDSFRRMLLWFSNHLLVEPAADGSWDDLALDDALLAGRLFGVFEYMGYAEGFDAVIEAGGEVFELGAEVPLGDGPEIVVQRPGVRNLDPGAMPPVITTHVLRAIDGGFEEVATEAGPELRYAPDAPGAYRVEVRMAPLHLTEYLGSHADGAATPRVWIYANPFYVMP
ncbi:hypothetical protein [Paraliomyxa miuraensis]|uniref:hypothetical protein n=1 Tax=Paraliomyxa miuraensis TaxID=376150 RepID=UPI00224CF0A1|nr:hypothetical protein [Paraliomyxa miuraensis]MCX4241793.1 hypothetical protein [Paraliomyxa miuraensis]